MLNHFFLEDDSLKLFKSKRITSFSDLIIVSIELKEVENFDIEIMSVFYLLINAIRKGFLLRGSIVYGKLIHNDNMIFGSGLIEAYYREKEIAKYPRIIIDKAIVSDLKEMSNKNITVTIDDVISYDKDGQCYIDVFKNMREYVDNFWQYTRILNGIVGIILNIIENPKLVSKSSWLLSKFVDHVLENSEALNYSFNSKKVTKNDLVIFQHYLKEFDNDNYKRAK